MKYTESTNTWTNTLPNPCPDFDRAFSGGIGHAYQHNTINPNTGNFYHRQYGTGKVMVFSHSTQSWSQIAPVPSGAFQVAGALEYFPDRNSLVFLDGDWGVWEHSLSTGTWTQRASTVGGGFTPQLTGVGSYHNVAQYSSACRCVLLGGGGSGRALYRLDSNAVITRMADAPFSLSTPEGNGSGSIITADPVSGRVLAWTSNGTGYDYDPVANTFRTTGRNAPFTPTPTGGISNAVAVPIADYGVVMLIVSDGSNTGKVYLYKHSTN